MAGSWHGGRIQKIQTQILVLVIAMYKSLCVPGQGWVWIRGSGAGTEA